MNVTFVELTNILLYLEAKTNYLEKITNIEANSHHNTAKPCKPYIDDPAERTPYNHNAYRGYARFYISKDA